MNTGMSGSVSTMITTEVRSIAAVHASTAIGTRTAKTSCGRYRAKYASSPSTPLTAAVAISPASAPSAAVGMSKRRRSTNAIRSSDVASAAALRPVASNPAANTARATRTPQNAMTSRGSSGRCSNARATIAANNVAWIRSAIVARNPKRTSAARATRAGRTRRRSRGSSGRTASGLYRRASCRCRGRPRPGCGRTGRGCAGARQPLPEHVIRPALIDHDDRKEDDRHDRHHLERVGCGRRVLHRQVVGVLDTITFG